MIKVSLEEATDDLLAQARAATSGRAAQTVPGGSDRVLRQTVLALRSGCQLSEHASPGEATLQVLAGRVRLDAGTESSEGNAGSLIVIPSGLHSLAALEDAVVLLSVVSG